MSKNPKEIYEFSRYRLEVSERRLTRDGRVVHLTDKAFDTLCVLVRRHGELVGKDELLGLVWPGTIVEENNLDQKISMLRATLGERGKRTEKFIETVRGHGYRFVADVRGGDGEDPPPMDAQVPGQRAMLAVDGVSALRTDRAGMVHAGDDSASDRRDPLQASAHQPAASSHGWKFWTVLGGLALATLLAFVLPWPKGPAASTATPIDSIAVLPVVNATGDADNEYLTDGLTDSMIGRLSQVPGLSVRARSSVFRYQGRKVEPVQAARELSVQGVLTGVLAQRGDDIALTMELVDGSTGNALWNERYERKQGELVPLLGEVARDVAYKLRSRLTRSEEQRITKAYTADPEANRLYFQARYHLNKRTPEDIGKSIDLFEQAAACDPSYAKAYAGIAEASIILSDYSPTLTREAIRQSRERARAAYLRARELDDTLPEVHVISAAMHELNWELRAADAEYRRAIELDPNFATAHHWYSHYLGCMGRNGEAIAHIQKALELDPFSVSIAFNVGARYLGARRLDDAVAQFRRVLEMEPDHALTHAVLSTAYDAKGMYGNAIEEARVAAALFNPARRSLAARRAAELQRALESAGPRAYWQQRLAQDREDLANGTGSLYRVAVPLARLGEVEETLAYLERSWAEREPELLRIRAEPAFDALGRDSRFIDLLRRIGVQE